jgi:hypothetical protein
MGKVSFRIFTKLPLTRDNVGGAIAPSTVGATFVGPGIIERSLSVLSSFLTLADPVFGHFQFPIHPFRIGMPSLVVQQHGRP